MSSLKFQTNKKELISLLKKLESSDSKKVILSMVLNLERTPGMSFSLIQQFIRKDEQGYRLIDNLQELADDYFKEDVLELVEKILESFEKELMHDLIINQNPMGIKFAIDEDVTKN